MVICDLVVTARSMRLVHGFVHGPATVEVWARVWTQEKRETETSGQSSVHMSIML